MEKEVKEELDRYLESNPNASQYEIALHFFLFRSEYNKKVEEELPRYYGD